MRLRNLVLLFRKEWRELFASRAFWLMLLIIGPLVGHGFITAVRLYAEASGSGGGPAALPQALTPLDGILVPTFGAYDLAATFLLPFVAIRLIALEKETGGLKLLLQLPESIYTKVGIKSAVLLTGWLVAAIPGLIAVVLWKSYGGHLYGPETLNLVLGHGLRMMLATAIALAAAALAGNAASAAIVTLGVTVGSWVIDFVAAGRGGILQVIANYTPAAALRSFEQGLLRLNTVVVMFAFILAGLALTAVWLQIGRSFTFRFAGSAVILLLLSVTITAGAAARSSRDVSENRRNSFAGADEAALRQINQPLKITLVLAPEDPRLADYEQNVLKKLRRVLPHLEVNYAAESQTGLFDNAGDHYGEIWYEMNGQKAMERSTIDAVVLEQIYRLSGTNPPAQTEENDFPGYPLAANPRHASLIFYVLWPLATMIAWWFVRR
ncbi:MAG TPA: hypothetical protein VJT50_01205 [Pyrinomonadaceae bacterium]|nr:hypothetical protein [Pyrinomonadaceae bacterium]